MICSAAATSAAAVEQQRHHAAGAKRITADKLPAVKAAVGLITGRTPFKPGKQGPVLKVVRFHAYGLAGIIQRSDAVSDAQVCAGSMLNTIHKTNTKLTILRFITFSSVLLVKIFKGKFYEFIILPCILKHKTLVAITKTNNSPPLSRRAVVS